MSQNIKNPIIFVRNPNSPEAIQARLDGYGNITPFNQAHLITDNTAGHINIDLTQEQVFQKVGYALTGGTKFLNKKLVRNSTSVDSQGRAIMTSYYVDVRNQQWVSIRGFYNPTPIAASQATGPTRPTPLPTVGGTFGGFFASARGENWRNEGRAKADIVEAQKRVYATTPIEPGTDQTTINPTDEFTEDFTGKQ